MRFGKRPVQGLFWYSFWLKRTVWCMGGFPSLAVLSQNGCLECLMMFDPIIGICVVLFVMLR